METTDVTELRYDPYDVRINADPYPAFRRLREEAPLYYNDEHDFFALESLRGRRAGSARPRDLHLGSGCDHRGDPCRHRDAAGRHHLRGPSDPHAPPRAALAGVHAEEDERARTGGPGVLRGEPRPVGRERPVRLRRRPRGPDADAGHRDVARDPGAGPGRHPAQRGRFAADGGRSADGRLAGELPDRRDVRRLHRLAGRASVRRPHDRAAQRGVRGRDGHHAHARAKRSSPM